MQGKPSLGVLAQESLQEEPEAGLEMMDWWTCACSLPRPHILTSLPHSLRHSPVLSVRNSQAPGECRRWWDHEMQPREKAGYHCGELQVNTAVGCRFLAEMWWVCQQPREGTHSGPTFGGGSKGLSWEGKYLGEVLPPCQGHCCKAAQLRNSILWHQWLVFDRGSRKWVWCECSRAFEGERRVISWLCPLLISFLPALILFQRYSAGSSRDRMWRKFHSCLWLYEISYQTH